MPSNFTGPAPRGVYPRPADAFGDDYTRPLAAVPPYGTLAAWPAASPHPRFHAPGPWGPPPVGPDPRRRAGTWVAAGGAAAMVVAAAVAVGVVTERSRDRQPAPPLTSAPTAPPTPEASPAPVAPPPAVVGDTDLVRMLPQEAHVAEVVGAASLQPMDKLNGPGLLSGYSDPAACVSTIIPADKSAYVGSGVRATYVQALHDPDRSATHMVLNTVTAFDSASEAELFASTQAVTWQGCRTAPVNLDRDDEKPMIWVVKDVEQRGGMLTAHTHVRDGGTYCQRALVVKMNVVNDVAVCTDMPSDAAVRLAEDTIGRLGQAT
jgi:hypothetical protein